MSSITEQEKNLVWDRIKEPEALFAAFLSIENKEELKAFFRDLMTEKEIEEFDMRWRLARMLDGGKTFVEIEQATGISPNTIARINKWLKEGTGGYKAMISKLQKKGILKK